MLLTPLRCLRRRGSPSALAPFDPTHVDQSAGYRGWLFPTQRRHVPLAASALCSLPLFGVLEGADMFEAVMETKEEMQHEARTIVPIGALEGIGRCGVTVEGL